MSRKTWTTGQKGLLILLPVTKYTHFYLNHFFNFELFIFENEIKIDVCLLLSFSHLFLSTEGAENNNNNNCEYFFEILLQQKFVKTNDDENALYLVGWLVGWLVIFEWWNKFAIFFWGLNGGSRVRKISVILNIKNQKIKLN